MLNKFNKSGTDVAIILSIIEIILLISARIKYVAYGDFGVAMTIYIIILGFFIVAKLKLKKDSKLLRSPVYGGLLTGFTIFVILHIISTIVGFSVNMNMDYTWVGFFMLFPFFLIIFTLVGMFLGFIYSIVKKHLLS